MRTNQTARTIERHLILWTHTTYVGRCGKMTEESEELMTEEATTLPRVSVKTVRLRVSVRCAAETDVLGGLHVVTC